MPKTLDRFDQKILTLLRQNSRLPTSKIAAQINLSRNAVRQRIERLERDGVIEAYTLRTRAPEQDSNSITAFMMVFRKDRMRGDAVINCLQGMEEVRQCFVLSGEFDLLVQLQASSQERMRAIWQEITALEGVQNTTTSFVLKQVIDLP